MRNAVPCSLGVIGYSSVRERISKLSSWISTPIGERLSSLTVPVTRIVDSWVTFSISAQASSDTSLRPATAWTVPPAQRTWRKAILPLDRLLSSQPERTTRLPMFRVSSRMDETGVGSLIGTRIVSYRTAIALSLLPLLAVAASAVLFFVWQ